MLDAKEIITLGALVSTEKGEGLVFGRCLYAKPRMFDILLFDGTKCCSYPNIWDYPVVREINLIDRHPVEHPNVSPGMREFLEYQNHDKRTVRGSRQTNHGLHGEGIVHAN